MGFICAPNPAVPLQPDNAPVAPIVAVAQAIQALAQQGLNVKNIAFQGKRAADVIVIQKILNADPATRIALKGPGSPGKETNLFGIATKAAVIKFQLKYGIVKSSRDIGYGVVGPKTKAKMNELLSKKN